MRSQQVYHALSHIPNRFALCRITSIALKKLHKTNTRPEETINNVLQDIDRYKSRRAHEGEVAAHKAVDVASGLVPEFTPETKPHSDLVFVGF